MTTDRTGWIRYNRHGEDKLDEWAAEAAEFEAAAEADAIVAQEYERVVAGLDLGWEFGA
jgi:hypothetical protein